MKKFKVLAILLLLVPLTSCEIFFGSDTSSGNTSSINTTSNDNKNTLKILNGSEVSVLLNETLQLNVEKSGLEDPVLFSIPTISDQAIISVNETGLVTGLSVGSGTVKVTCGDLSQTILIIVNPLASFTLSAGKTNFKVGENTTLSVSTIANVIYSVISGEKCVTISGQTVTAKREGIVKIRAQEVSSREYSNELTITIKGFTANPYTSMTATTFYSDYYTATSYEDAAYRTAVNFMSGSIEDQVQDPTISSNRPTYNGKLIKNSVNLYNENKTSYTIVNYQGVAVNTIYKGGAYATLEEVAAYIYAFGDVPANYSASKSTRPSSSPWGKWLRVNNTAFSGDTSKYPYEPALPDISGVGNGQTKYYETDIGTTGTDCDPSYAATIYNNGTSITRGAARIVYTKSDLSGNPLTDYSKVHVFYTYNHYNDFQEYLNYENGWANKFGNITGGGELSSKVNYNPTDYPAVEFRSLL